MYYYENEYGDSISISYDSDEYILKNIDGVDSLKNTLATVKGLYQDGFTIVNTDVEARYITITGLYIANDHLKDNLLKVFNPKVPGTLYRIKDGYNRKIACVVESSPIFKTGSYLHEFQVRLTCGDPYWKDTEDTEVLFASISAAFEFPVEFNSQFELSTVDSIKAKDIENDGDVDSPIFIEFIANGAVTNPYLENSLERIKLQKITLNKGDRVVINTERDNKSVTVYRASGTVEKGFKYLHYTSKFIQLKRGVTRFTYGAEANIENLGIRFKFTKRYVGVV